MGGINSPGSVLPWANPSANFIPQGVVQRPFSGSSPPPAINYAIDGNNGFGQMQQVQAYTQPNGQIAIGSFANNTGTLAGANNPGAWTPETNPQILQNWAQSLGVPLSSFVNPTNAQGGNPNNGWTTSTPILGQTTSGQGAASGMMGTGGMNTSNAAGMTPQALGSFLAGSGGAIPSSMASPVATSGDINGTMASIPGASPSSFQNFIPPAPQNLYNTLGGGSMPTPVGGYWNQVAQQMAGPMFGPYGASTLMGAQNPTQAAQPSPLLQPPRAPSTGTSALGYIPTQLPMTSPSSSGGSGLAALGSLGSSLNSLGNQGMNPLLAQKLGTVLGMRY